MPKGSNSKCTQCRREGEKLFLKGEKCSTGKCSMVKRNYPPGQHGGKGRGRMSNYGQQLREKQKAKRQYGLKETQFYNYFQKAEQQAGDTAESLSRLLESRLDNVVYRLGIGTSRVLSRQLVSHGQFLVNGRSTDIPSFQVRVNDTIQVKPNRITKKYFQDTLKRIAKYETPVWLTLDKSKLEGKVLALPSAADLKQNFQTQLIIEFYSR
jgi:small subunit ribosomal protein S4